MQCFSKILHFCADPYMDLSCMESIWKQHWKGNLESDLNWTFGARALPFHRPEEILALPRTQCCCPAMVLLPASPQKQSPKTKLLMTEYFCLYPWSNYKVSARSRHERWRWRLTREAKASLKEEPLGIKLWPVEGGHLAMYSFLSPCQITFVHVPRLFRTHRFFFVDTWIILGMWSDWTMVLLPVFPSRSPNFFLQIQRFFLTWCHCRAEVRFVGYDPWLFGACHSRGQLDIL